MTSRGLFSNNAPPGCAGPLNVATKASEVGDHRIKVERSGLWAAYGDALGWISELTDARGLARRTSGEPLRTPIEWGRRIGGRTGVTATLPRGCYSDDSQLRLATGRAIGPDGFDVEVFAKVELPVWLSYGLGGGRATSTAAEHLAKPNVSWFANTFKGWANSGGNGAAMRVQPHIWAAASPGDADSFLLDVIRNTVCTHSHPTGLMGSVLHSLALAWTLNSGRSPSPADLSQCVEIAASLPKIIRSDREVGTYWLGVFERESGSFNVGWSQAVADARDAIDCAREIPTDGSGAERYGAIVERLGLQDPARRGSGILTAVAATALTWCEPRPKEALQVAANAIGTDTDSIATMAGAILGITAESEPPIDVLDAQLFRAEAARLSEIASGGQPPSHDYPDLLHWSPPRTRADSLAILEDGGLYVRGLGRAEAMSEPIQSPLKQFNWQWLKLAIGQTLLIKRRRELETASESIAEPSGTSPRGRELLEAHGDLQVSRGSLKAEDGAPPTRKESTSIEPHRSGTLDGLDLGRALRYVADRRDDDRIVGKALRKVVREGSPGEIAGFTAGLIDLMRQTGDPLRTENLARQSIPDRSKSE